MALAQKVTKEDVLGDRAAVTGVFESPSVPSNLPYLDPGFCEKASSALDCLRLSSHVNTGARIINSFAGYFPSFISGLGINEVKPLIFPATNGLQLKIRLKD